MVNIPYQRQKCDTCNIKLPKTQPQLFCTQCNKLKHLACQKLTKADAKNIISLKVPWTCKECIFETLPVNACSMPKRDKKSTIKKFKVQCSACNGFSYTPSNIRTCCHCEQQVHVKCWNQSLGCHTCCENLIPGYHSYAYELLGDSYLRNNKTYNPYRVSHFMQQIGNTLENEINNCNDHNLKQASDLLINCRYKHPSTVSPSSNQELNILSLNIGTLLTKVETLRENIDLYSKFDVLLLNETNCITKNLPNGISDVALPGFHNPILQDPLRTSGKGGGLAIYVNKHVCDDEDDIVSFEPYNEPENFSGEFQFIKLKECKGHRKTIVLVNVYRSPSNKPEKFNDYFNLILQKLDTNRYANKNIYIAGDFNQDLIQHDDNSDCQNLINNAHNHGFIQIVARPTRLTDHSATLIDHVYTNNIDSVLSCNILTLDVSDHLAAHNKISLGSSTLLSKINATKQKYIQTDFRIMNEANHEKFKNLINDEPWSEISDDMDAQTAFDNFDAIYLRHYNSAYPLNSNRSRRKNERLNSKPWILPWLEGAISRKQNAYHAFVKDPCPENKSRYDKLKLFCGKHIDIAKQKYRKAYFEKYKNNSKKQWQMINNLLGRKSKTLDIHKLTNTDGTSVTTPGSIANTFCEYFSTIASNLKNSTGTGTEQNSNMNSYKHFLKDPVDRSIYLRKVDPGEIYNIIRNFGDKSTCDTKIEALKIANTAFTFTNSLAKIINKSFKEGVFPEQMKIAKVIPIHKDGSKINVGSYRPISLLTTFSKIYEKLIHIRMLNFLESNNSLFDNQYGFRPQRSCEHALLNAQNSLLDSLSKHQVSLLLLIDFSKAFDMVDHKILLRKLEHYGIRGIALKWMQSYLSGRKQFVSISGKNSETKEIQFGVPQGSILGPLLFIIYINDIPETASFAKFILYADDANIILTADNIEAINTQLNSLISRLVNWVESNGFAINLKKTKYMIFSRSRNIELPSPLNICNTAIERKHENKFLGVIIDESLTWTSHIKTVISKMSRYVGIMYKIKKFLPLTARLQIYHSFVQSHLNYCSLVWGFATNSMINSLFSRQKKGLRAVIPGYINYKYKDGVTPGHTKPWFLKYKILTIHNIITLNTHIFIQKVHHFPMLLPPSIAATIPKDSPTQNSTFESSAAWLEKYDNNNYRKSIFYKGPLLVKSSGLEENLSAAGQVNIKTYKNDIRHSILEKQGNGDAVEWQSVNLPLQNIEGLRKSKVQYRTAVNYKEQTYHDEPY